MAVVGACLGVASAVHLRSKLTWIIVGSSAAGR